MIHSERNINIYLIKKSKKKAKKAN